MTTTNYAQRVANGAKFFDETEPGWAAVINTDRLDIEDTTNCVAGQIYTDRADAAGYFSGYGWATRNVPGLDCCTMGLCGTNDNLRQHWLLEIAARTIDTGRDKTAAVAS